MPFPEQDASESAGRSVAFTERDIREAERLLKMIVAAPDLQEPTTRGEWQAQSAEAAGREALLARARKHLRERELRTRFLNPDALGEPAWETMLVLYISEFYDRRLTVGKLSDWIRAPLATTQRWLAYLEKRGFIGKEDDPQDRRLVYVKLLASGRELLDDYFAAAAEQS